MLLFTWNAILLIASCASAYENSSPFYLYSTSNFEIPPIRDLSLASSVQPIITKSLSQCPTKNYIIVSQPGISADDFTNARVAYLGEHIVNKTTQVQTTVTVRDVIGTVDASAIKDSLKSACDIRSVYDLDGYTDVPMLEDAVKSNIIVHIEFPALHESLSSKERMAVLHNHDYYLSQAFAYCSDYTDYTVIYTSSSREAGKLHASSIKGEQYFMDDDDVAAGNLMHQDLRRELGANLAKGNGTSRSNQTIVDGPLFDKYQFLSPGIFMGGLIFLIILLVLYVGLSALLSLQVTYGAFDKEQGQLAGKKSQ